MMVKEGMRTPWGAAQTVTLICPGIQSVSTAGHGGIKLDLDHQKRMPDYLREEDGWYEEDCDWCKPFIVFEAEIIMNSERERTRTIEKKIHVSTFCNWFPDQYEKFFGTELKPGESTTRDEAVWYEANKHRLICVSAIGTPHGAVRVTACVGGRDPKSYRYAGELREFLVLSEEYAAREGPFIIDPSRHPETKPTEV